jgi:hypothetical protein
MQRTIVGRAVHETCSEPPIHELQLDRSVHFAIGNDASTVFGEVARATPALAQGFRRSTPRSEPVGAIVARSR